LLLLLLLLLQPSEAAANINQHTTADHDYGCNLHRRAASLWVLLALLVLAFAIGAGDGPAEGAFEMLLFLCYAESGMRESLSSSAINHDAAAAAVAAVAGR
jgi:hypothetical protein